MQVLCLRDILQQRRSEWAVEGSGRLGGWHFNGERHDRVLATSLSSPSNRLRIVHQCGPKIDGFRTSGVSHGRKGEAVRAAPSLSA